MSGKYSQHRIALLAASLLASSAQFSAPSGVLLAQAAAAPASARQIGTVKAINGNDLTIATDAGQQISVSISGSARVLQLAPGSTDLKTAQASSLSEVAVGDRVLASGSPGDSPTSMTATRLILMKSGAIAQRNEKEQQDWQRRGGGGLVSAVDASSGKVTITSGTRKTEVVTSADTKFRRYASDSVRFEDAKPGTFADIHSGDQLRVRGDRTPDGASVKAEEVVSGAFQNLSGTLSTVDAAGGKITLKDLTTKKNVTVLVTANSSVRALPPQAAAMFAARERGGAGAPGAPGAPGAGAQGSPASTGPAGAPPAGASGGGAGRARPEEGSGPARAGRSAGADLSQMVARLPSEPLSSLHVGDAVMIVASQATPGSSTVTAVTLLSGVEPILAAAPSGSQGMTLSPWSVGEGMPEGGGGNP